LCLLEQDLAFRREQDLLRRSAKEQDADLLFQVADLHADRGRRPVRFLCGFPEAFVLGREEEGMEKLESDVRQALTPRSSSASSNAEGGGSLLARNVGPSAISRDD